MHHPGRCRRPGGVLAAALVTAFALPLLVAPASPAGGQATDVVAHAADFATDAYGQPWDFSDPGQVILDSGPSRLPGARIEQGLLRFSLTEQGHTPLVWHGYPGALWMGREGLALPIDADRYTRLALRVNASQETTGSVFWDRCVHGEGQPAGQCRGNIPFRIDAGWSTVHVDLAGEFTGTHAWAGQVYALWLGFSGRGGTTFEVDWARVYEPTTAAVQAASWDAEGVAGSRGKGADGGTWDPDAYPPGTYAVETPGGARALQVAHPPIPSFEAPHERGGEDYATAVRGRPWNMQSTSDVASVHNAQQVSFSGGTLHATNGPPDQNDPHLYLAMGAQPLDPHRYHRLTVVTDYDGPFGLADAIGGGTHGRLTWRTAAIDSGEAAVPHTLVQSREIVTYTNSDTYTVSLATDPPSFVHETDLPYRFGWRASPVTAIRYDPNEDRGTRRWRVRSVELRADHEAVGGAFDVRLSNAAGTAPTTLSLYAAPDGPYRPGSRPQGGTAIVEGLPVPASGDVTYRWDTAGVVPDRYRLWAEASDGTTTTRRWASGPLRVPGRFVDTDGNVHVAAIYTLADTGVTTGCTANRYCPARAVTRGQMATFLTRALDLPAAGDHPFRDVPAGHPHAAGIAAAHAAGVTEGRPDGTYAPDAPVRRDQMASFLARAFELPAAPATFTDTGGNVHAGAIGALAASGVTQGCTADRYCPGDPVRRDQMAAFLTRALEE